VAAVAVLLSGALIDAFASNPVLNSIILACCWWASPGPCGRC
jgi:hypothetical protein